jgi:hypothetical protein
MSDILCATHLHMQQFVNSFIPCRMATMELYNSLTEDLSKYSTVAFPTQPTGIEFILDIHDQPKLIVSILPSKNVSSIECYTITILNCKGEYIKQKDFGTYDELFQYIRHFCY